MGKATLVVAFVAGLLVLGYAPAQAKITQISIAEGTVVHESFAVKVTKDVPIGEITVYVDAVFRATGMIPFEFEIEVPGPMLARAEGTVGATFRDGPHQLTVIDTVTTYEGDYPRTVEKDRRTINIVLQNAGSPEALTQGVLLQNDLRVGRQLVALVGALSRVEGNVEGAGAGTGATAPAVLRCLESGLQASVDETLVAQEPSGMVLAERRLGDNIFARKVLPGGEWRQRTLEEYSQEPGRLGLLPDGMPRLLPGTARPFEIGVPYIQMPDKVIKKGESWDGNIAVVTDLTRREIMEVPGHHTLTNFLWREGLECAVIQSNYQYDAPLTVLVNDYPFTFGKVRTSGERTTYYAFREHQYVAASEKLTHTIAISPWEQVLLRTLQGPVVGWRPPEEKPAEGLGAPAGPGATLGGAAPGGGAPGAAGPGGKPGLTRGAPEIPRPGASAGPPAAGTGGGGGGAIAPTAGVIEEEPAAPPAAGAAPGALGAAPAGAGAAAAKGGARGAAEQPFILPTGTVTITYRIESELRVVEAAAAGR